MNARRGTVRRVVVASSAAGLATAGLLAVGVNAGSSASVAPPSWSRMEHRAHQFAVDAQQEQARVLNPREHEGHRQAATSGTVPATDQVESCTDRLARAWAELGHFSDGYATYLLRQPPCSVPQQ